jgi:hypothetical protein
MINRAHDFHPAPRSVAALFALALCGGLSGCADVGDSFASGAFIDPAKYELFDCKQLEAERKALAVRTAELQGLIAKADTGVGGSVVGELAYRNDYISARASAKLAEETWRRNRCAARSAAAPGPAPGAPVAPAGVGARSGSAVY